MLTSKCIKGVNVGFPLLIKPKDIVETQIDFNRDFISRLIPKVDWDALCQAADNIGKSNMVPRAVVSNFEGDEEFLKSAHHILLEVEVVNGELECPETGRKFPIQDGIPNMLLNEDEI